MSQKLWWFKTYLKQLKRHYLGKSTDRDKGYVVERYSLAGVREVCRVAKSRVVFLEPDFVNSNAAQRLFLKTHNYLVNFSKTIESVAPGKLVHTELHTYFNVKNKTGLFVVNMEAGAEDR